MTGMIQRETYSTSERTTQEQIVAQLTRIADALEAATQPPMLLTVSDAELDDRLRELRSLDVDEVLMRVAEPEIERRTTPKRPIASNGLTYVYIAPGPGYHIVARRDDSARGFSVDVEEDHGHA